MFLNLNIFFQFELFEFIKSEKLQEQVKKASCYQKLFWPLTGRIDNSSDLKNFVNSRPSAKNYKTFS